MSKITCTLTLEDRNYDELAREARREIGQRHRVYPRQIEMRRMSYDQAMYQTALMEQIAELLEEIARVTNHEQGDLFGTD